MTQVERIALAFERGKAAVASGLRWKACPYGEGMWLRPWFHDGMIAADRQRIKEERTGFSVDKRPREV